MEGRALDGMPLRAVRDGAGLMAVDTTRLGECRCASRLIAWLRDRQLRSAAAGRIRISGWYARLVRGVRQLHCADASRRAGEWSDGRDALTAG